MEKGNQNNLEQPLTSVIVPTYNTASYIKEAVDSALAQTYPNVEIIVVDDGSTDSTKEILQPYINLGTIKYIYQDNKGLSGARNTAIRAARGKYIALLDADDIFLPEKLSYQVNYLEKNENCDMSYCDIYHFKDGEPNKLLKLNYTYYSGRHVFEQLIKRNFIAPLSVVLRMSVFDRFGYFDEELKRSEDWEFFLRIAYAGVRIDFLPECLAKLRLRQTSNLQGLDNQPKMKLSSLKVLEMTDEKMGDEDKRRYQIQNYIKRHQRKIGWAYLMTGHKKNARRYLNPLVFLITLVIPSSFLRKILAKAYYKRQSNRFSPTT